MKTYLMVCGALAASWSANANVWSDATAVYTGNAVNLVDGYLDRTSLKDVRHAADASAATHGSQWIAAWDTGYRTVAMEKSDVVCANAGITLSNQDVLHFNPTVGGDGKISGEVLELNAPLATNRYTAIFRFKMDATQPRIGSLYLLSLGYRWPDCGVAIQCDISNNTLKAVWGSASVSDFSDIVPDGALADWLDNWVEFAVIVDGQSLTIGAATPGAPMRWKTETGNWFHEKLSPGCLPRIGGYSAVKWASADNSHFSARSIYHLSAFWNRPLSKEEVVEAFAAPKSELWRLGGEGYGHEMFAGTVGATVSADMQSATKVPAVLSSSESFQVQFAVPAEKSHRPQRLKLVPASTIENAAIAFALDGVALSGAKVDPSGRWTVQVPGGRLASGAHTLSVSRTDSEAAGMVFDELSMSARSDVWSDALAVYSGNAVNGASGYLDVSTIKDVRRAGIADALTHGAEWCANWEAGKQGVRMVKSDVVCGGSGRTLPNQDVLHFASPTNSEGKIASECVTFPVDITTNRYTAIFRFKLAEAQPHVGVLWILNMGYTWPTRGLALKCDTSNNMLYAVWGSGSTIDVSSIVPDGELANWFGNWVEMAIIVDGNSFIIGAARAGEPMRWKTESGDWFRERLTPGGRPCIGGYSATTWYETSDSYFGASAIYHLVAYWDRPLAREEATAALSAPAPVFWRLGAETYGNEMFAGEAGVELNAMLQQAAKVPSRLAAGQSFTIKFNVTPELAGRAQVVRIVPSSASSTAQFALTLDGSDLPKLLVSPNGDCTTFARRSLMGSGEHSLVVRRIDSGVQPAALELVEMIGSFRYGIADGTMDEFAGDAGISIYNFNWGFTKQVRSHMRQGISLTFGYDLPASVAENYRFEFSMKPSWRNGATFNLPIVVNDATIDNWQIDSDALRKTKIDVGMFNEGENTLFLQPGSHYNIDYIDIDVVSQVKRKGLVISFF